MNLLKAIISGPPGTGKTALLCSAAEAGYRVIRCAFEPGVEVLDAYCGSGRERIFNLPFEDETEMDGDVVKRLPHAMTAFEHFVFNGKVDGKRPFGPPAGWGPETLVVVDTLTSAGECSECREEAKGPTSLGKHLWEADLALKELAIYMVGSKRTYHVLWLSHLRLLSPKTETGYVNKAGELVGPDTKLQVQVKKERAQLEDTGYYPSCVTGSIARNFVSRFPFSLLTDLDPRAKSGSGRVVRTKSIEGYQIKCPLQNLDDKLPVETALATILKRLGGTA